MSSLQDILNLNIVDNIFSYVEIGDRLKDEDGENIKFKIKPILFEDLNRLKNKATIFGKDGNPTIDEGYLNLLCIIESTVEPNFKNADSIERLGLTTPEQYLNKVLLAGEIDTLIKEILNISGFITDIKQKVDEIKN